MTTEPTLNCLPSWVLHLHCLPQAPSRSVIHLVLRGLARFPFSWPPNLPVFLFLIAAYLLLFPSWSIVSLCEHMDLSVGGIPGVGPVVSPAAESGIDDSPGNWNHNPGSCPNMQGPAQTSLCFSSFKTYAVTKQSHSWTCRIFVEL